MLLALSPVRALNLLWEGVLGLSRPGQEKLKSLLKL